MDENGCCIRPGELGPNVERIAGDGTNPWDLTSAELQSRTDTYELLAFLRGKVPGYENAYLLNLPFAIGVRETRRITGEYTITGEDVLGLAPIVRLENFISSCDCLDLQILKGVLQGENYEKLSEQLFVSSGTVNYRLKKFYKTLYLLGRQALEEMLLPAIDLELL